MVHKHLKSLALRLVLVLVVLVVAAGFRAAPASAQDIENYFLPLSGGGLNSCTNEWVEMTGEIHILSFDISNAQGGFVRKELVQDVNILGVGSDTGAVYHFVGFSQETMTVSPATQTYTLTTRFTVITDGPNNNEVYSVLLHITYDDTGNPVAWVENSSWGCQ